MKAKTAGARGLRRDGRQFARCEKATIINAEAGERAEN